MQGFLPFQWKEWQFHHEKVHKFHKGQIYNHIMFLSQNIPRQLTSTDCRVFIMQVCVVVDIQNFDSTTY